MTASNQPAGAMPFRIDRADGIAELVIAQPPVNALDAQGWHALSRALDALGEDDDVRVIVVRGEGRGFCAGVDIKELAAHPERIVSVNAGNYETFRAVHRNPKPVIAAVHGFVLGGGIGICGAADIVVAADCARFGVPEIDRGAMGGGAHLQRLFGVQKVRAMYFTGDMIDAAEGERIGLIDYLVSEDGAAAEFEDIVKRVSAANSKGCRLSKNMLESCFDLDFESFFSLYKERQTEATGSDDFREAMTAYRENRPPNWS